MRFIELLNEQLLIDACLGITISILFTKEFATGDARSEKRELTDVQKIIKVICMVFSIIIALYIGILFVNQWNDAEYHKDQENMYSVVEDYRRLALYISEFFIITALAGYTWRFGSSPRSMFVKIRKAIGYYLFIGAFGAHVMRSVSYGYIYNIAENGYSIPTLLGECSVLIVVWLLIKHYKTDKFILERNKQAPNNTLITLCEASLNDVSQKSKSRMHQVGCDAHKPSKITKIENKKRMIAYYLFYEIIIFLIAFVLVIIMIVEKIRFVGITIAFFVVLSALPIGIYWILRLLNESESDNNNE